MDHSTLSVYAVNVSLLTLPLILATLPQHMPACTRSLSSSACTDIDLTQAKLHMCCLIHQHALAWARPLYLLASCLWKPASLAISLKWQKTNYNILKTNSWEPVLRLTLASFLNEVHCKTKLFLFPHKYIFYYRSKLHLLYFSKNIFADVLRQQIGYLVMEDFMSFLILEIKKNISLSNSQRNESPDSFSWFYTEMMLRFTNLRE